MYIDYFHSIVRCLSAGCTGSKRNACLISTFAKKGIRPTLKDFDVSIIHCHIHEATQCLGIPSLTL